MCAACQSWLKLIDWLMCACLTHDMLILLLITSASLILSECSHMQSNSSWQSDTLRSFYVCLSVCSSACLPVSPSVRLSDCLSACFPVSPLYALYFAIVPIFIFIFYCSYFQLTCDLKCELVERVMPRARERAVAGARPSMRMRMPLSSRY